jgi:hypothetical protein
MLKPIDRAAVVEYVDPSDTAEPLTVWLLRPLTKRTRSLILNDAAFGHTQAGGAVEVRTRQGTIAYRQVKAGLFGVRNFPGWADEPAPEDVGRGKLVPTDAFLDTVPDPVFDRLASRVVELSWLQEDDAGKSSRPPT